MQLFTFNLVNLITDTDEDTYANYDANANANAYSDYDTGCIVKTSFASQRHAKNQGNYFIIKTLNSKFLMWHFYFF